MRWLSSAICTSGEPVSPSAVAYSAMIFFLVSASVRIDTSNYPSSYSLRGAPGPVHPGTLDPRPMHGGCHPIGQLPKAISAAFRRRIGERPPPAASCEYRGYGADHAHRPGRLQPVRGDL